MTFDEKEDKDLDREFERFLARIEEIERASDARRAVTGEKPIRVLVGVNPATRTVAVVPVFKISKLPPSGET
jgi:hypothetical protein